MIDHLQIEDVLDAATVAWIRREMSAAERDPATVLGSTRKHRVASSTRKATQVAVGEAPRAAVVGLLERLQSRIEAHFGRSLAGFEEPQFLRYGAGDFFVAHQDGNTLLVHDESRFRKVSVVSFLSAPGTFGGGSLVLHAALPLTLAPAPGTLVAFPSETTHEGAADHARRAAVDRVVVSRLAGSRSMRR